MSTGEYQKNEEMLQKIAALEQELNETRLLELSVRRRLETAREAALRLEQENAQLRGQIIALEESSETAEAPEGAEDGA